MFHSQHECKRDVRILEIFEEVIQFLLVIQDCLSHYALRFRDNSRDAISNPLFTFSVIGLDHLVVA